MRLALYNYLTENCTSIPVWFQPYMATAEVRKPYGVIRLGSVIPQVNRIGSLRLVEVWPYVESSNYLPLDDAVKEIRRLLSGKVLTTEAGKRFKVEWVGESDDFYDPDLDALTRRIDFQVPLVGVL